MSDAYRRPSYVAAVRDRSVGPLTAGVALAITAFVAASLVERHVAHVPQDPENEGEFGAYWSSKPERPGRLLTAVWTPIVLALTFSGLRVWNSPASPRRAKALTLWAVVQGLNAAWTAWSPRRLGGQLTVAAASAGATLAYFWEAHRVRRAVDCPQAFVPEGASDIRAHHVD